MRGALIHIFTGLVLGVALAGLIHAPTQLVAQQEARTPVVRPKATMAGPSVEEQTVRISPKVERELERQRTRRLRPKTVRLPKRATADAPSALVRANVPETPVASPAPQPAYADEKLKPKPKPKPKPKEKAPPKSAPAAAPPPKVVASAPQPADEDNGKKPKKPKKAKKAKKDKADKKGADSPSDQGEGDNAKHDEHKHGDD